MSDSLNALSQQFPDVKLGLLDDIRKAVLATQPSEISDAETLVELIGNAWNEAKIHDNSPRWAVYNAMRPYLATQKPVLVSLKKCAIVAAKYIWNDRGNTASECAQAILDKAGVAYVD